MHTHTQRAPSRPRCLLARDTAMRAVSPPLVFPRPSSMGDIDAISIISSIRWLQLRKLRKGPTDRRVHALAFAPLSVDLQVQLAFALVGLALRCHCRLGGLGGWQARARLLQTNMCGLGRQPLLSFSSPTSCLPPSSSPSIPALLFFWSKHNCLSRLHVFGSTVIPRIPRLLNE